MRTFALAVLTLALLPAASAQTTCLSGDCEIGEGRATYTLWNEGVATVYTYEGRFFGGLPRGEGALTMANGWTYRGQFSGLTLDGLYLATHEGGQEERVRFDEGTFVGVVERILRPGGTPVGASSLALGRSISGSISSDDATTELTASDDVRHVDAYTLSLAAGDEITVRMESSNFDTYLKVVRGGEFVARNDDFGSTSVSQLTFTASAGGTYTVYAGPFTETGRGAYTLRATSAGRSGGKTTASGPTDETLVQGTLSEADRAVPLPISDEPRKADSYLVSLDRGQTLVVEMTSDDFDTYLRVERDGLKLAHNDDAGSTSRSFLEYTADRAGIVTVYAGTFHERGRGDYTLRYHVE